jgi:serine/threonine protein kinase
MSQVNKAKTIVVDEALISAYIDGRLETNLEQKIAAYLESHPEVVAKIAKKSGDGFLERLKDAHVRSLVPDDPIQASAPIAESPTPAPSSLSRSTELVAPKPLANYTGYQLLKELGRGGMGVVYLAKNVQLDRHEVLKVRNEQLLEHPGAKDRFLREVRAVSKLNHPSIVKSFSVLPIDELLVFAMEYVPGMDIHGFIRKHGPLPISIACSFASQIASGLQHAHDKGLVHRDIKPSNVMVYKQDGELQLKILDFGLSKATSEKRSDGLTQNGVLLGTPEYMAPEQTLHASKADILQA